MSTEKSGEIVYDYGRMGNLEIFDKHEIISSLTEEDIEIIIRDLNYHSDVVTTWIADYWMTIDDWECSERECSESDKRNYQRLENIKIFIRRLSKYYSNLPSYLIPD